MLVTQRKSKYKTKVEFEGGQNSWGWAQHVGQSIDMREWCEDRFGPGGRKKRWRFGWTQSKSTFYFKQEKDATMFVLKWCND